MTDSTGCGVVGALLLARSDPGREGHEGLAWARSDDQGHFTLVGLSDCVYQVEAVRLADGARGHALTGPAWSRGPEHRMPKHYATRGHSIRVDGGHHDNVTFRRALSTRSAGEVLEIRFR